MVHTHAELREQPSGLERLAFELNLDIRELVELIGGPWDVIHDPSAPERETRLPGFVVIGRVGPSVVIQVFEGRIRVGRAKGEWIGPDPLVWDMTNPITTIPRDDLQGRRADCRTAVEVAFKSKRRSLRVCRYCGELLAPELMFGKDQCYGCASQYSGVMY